MANPIRNKVKTVAISAALAAALALALSEETGLSLAGRICSVQA